MEKIHSLKELLIDETKRDIEWLESTYLTMPSKDNLSRATKKSYNQLAVRKMRAVTERSAELTQRDKTILARAAKLCVQIHAHKKKTRKSTIFMLSKIIEDGGLDATEELVSGIGEYSLKRSIREFHRLVLTGINIQEILDISSPTPIPETALITVVTTSKGEEVDCKRVAPRDLKLEIEWKAEFMA